MENVMNVLDEPSADSSDIMVLLVDDQAMVGEAVRRALFGQPRLQFHYCGDPAHLSPLFARLGVPLDVERLRSLMAERLTH